MNELSAYEVKALKALHQKKVDKTRQPTRHLVPPGLKERAGRARGLAKNGVGHVPGADLVQGAYRGAAGGLGKVVSRTAHSTLSDKRVLETFINAGVQLASLSELHGVDLKVIDDHAKLSRLRHRYATAALVEGGLTGLALTGGGAAVAAGGVFGLGAGAAPGLGAVAGAMAGDAAAVLAMSSRVVAHTAMYYGYDPRQPEEEIFLMSVIGLGMATGQSAKTAAYSELSQLTQLLAKKAPWAKLNEHLLSRIAQRFAARFGLRLGQRKLGQLVPIAGIAVGAGLNYAVLASIGEAANDAYRERYLLDKRGDAESDHVVTTSVVNQVQDDEIRLSVLDIVEKAELETERPGVTDTSSKVPRRGPGGS